MRRTFLFLLSMTCAGVLTLVVLPAAVSGAGANAWYTMSFMTEPRQDLGTASGACPTPNTARTCLYALGGLDNGVTGTAEYFDPTTDVWASIPSMSTPRVFFGAGAAPCKTDTTKTCIYAVGGDDNMGNTLASMEMYDPSTNAWTSTGITALPGSAGNPSGALDNLAAAGGPCPTPNTSRACLYVLGGNQNGGTSTAAVEVYDPSTNAWLAIGSMNRARNNLAATSGPCETNTTKTCIYALGGQTDTSPINGVSSVEMYDPSSSSNTWTLVQSMNAGRLVFGATTGPCENDLAATCLYAMGGIPTSQGYAPLSSAEMYDPTTNTWTYVASMNRARGDLGAATGPCVQAPSATCVYAIGGESLVAGTESTDEMLAPSGKPTFAPIRRFVVVRARGWTTFSWTLTARTGVVGFSVFAHHHRLNVRLIPIHRSPRYHFRVHAKVPGRCALEALLRDGRTLTIG